MPCRILQLVSHDNWYGAGSRVRELGSQLPPDQFTVQLCSLTCASSPNVRSLHQRWPVDPLAWTRLRYLIRHFRPNLLHAWDPVAGGYAALAVGRRRLPRLMVHFDWPSPHRSAWQRWVLQQTANRADLLVAPTAGVRQAWIDSGLRTRRAGQWQVVPTGVPPQRPCGMNRGELLATLALPAEAKLIAVAAPLVPRQQIKELIWAADMLRVLHPQLRLLIFGNGPERPHLERFARLAAEPEHICLLGERHEVGQLLPHFDLFWQGSETAEPSPWLLPAMAAGVPVVASDTPRHREEIKNGHTGCLVGLEDRAARTRVSAQLLSDRSLAEQIGQQGRAWVEQKHTLTTTVRQLTTIYRSLLTSAATSSDSPTQ